MLLGCKTTKILIDFVALISSHILSQYEDRPHLEDEAGVKSRNSEGKSVDLAESTHAVKKRTKVLD